MQIIGSKEVDYPAEEERAKRAIQPILGSGLFSMPFRGWCSFFGAIIIHVRPTLRFAGKSHAATSADVFLTILIRFLCRR